MATGEITTLIEQADENAQALILEGEKSFEQVEQIVEKATEIAANLRS